MPRKAIPKSVRFAVFRAAAFKCRYCGQSPPDVMLVIDHIIPVAAGGTNDIDNLCCACDSCNAGKSDRPACGPDDGIERLAMLQERMEELVAIRERAAAAKVVADMEGEIRDELWDHWCSLWTNPLDSSSTEARRFMTGCMRRVGHIGIHDMKEAMSVAASKCGWMHKAERYFWAILRNKLAEMGVEL